MTARRYSMEPHLFARNSGYRVISRTPRVRTATARSDDRHWSKHRSNSRFDLRIFPEHFHHRMTDSRAAINALRTAICPVSRNSTAKPFSIGNFSLFGIVRSLSIGTRHRSVPRCSVIWSFRPTQRPPSRLFGCAMHSVIYQLPRKTAVSLPSTGTPRVSEPRWTQLTKAYVNDNSSCIQMPPRASNWAKLNAQLQIRAKHAASSVCTSTGGRPRPGASGAWDLIAKLWG